jgi:hypothetical protein
MQHHRFTDTQVASLCRAAADLCDVTEYCNGNSPYCSTDLYLSSGAQCRSASGACDVGAKCSGSSPACPANALLPSTTLCRAAVDLCDAPDFCTGLSSQCAGDAKRPSNYVCRPSIDRCDLTDYCTGLSNFCPFDAKNASGSVADACGVCGGSGASCRDCRGRLQGTSRYDRCDVCDGDDSSCLDCTGALNGAAVYDTCDVCNGDGSSCLDCYGVPNGPKRYDVCDVCGGNGSSCRDCKGVANGPARYDACDVCGGNGSTCSDCKGVANGPSRYDVCDVCGGNGSTCRDCKGVTNGFAVYDLCGVCGDSSTCPDCAGRVKGSSRYDACDICGGDGSTCRDCRGMPNGPTRYDVCDVCGGNGSICRDCNGVPNGLAVYDLCGVCDGDSSTCLDCAGGVKGSSRYDACDVCDGDGTTCRDCRRVPNGPTLYDICDVCGGNGSTCRDCKGVANGAATYDACDVCGGNGSTCRDCRGVANGAARYDVCGVCGGNGSTCRDCRGVSNGATRYDVCDVCGGNGSTCSDCKGVANGPSRYDVCGVCDGDASTCPDCRGRANGTSTYDACDVCGGDNSSCRDCANKVNGASVYDVCDVCDGDGESCKVQFVRRWRLVINRSFDSWNWEAYRGELARTIGVGEDVLSQYRQAERGSVIAFVEHREPTRVLPMRAEELGRLWNDLLLRSTVDADVAALSVTALVPQRLDDAAVVTTAAVTASECAPWTACWLATPTGIGALVGIVGGAVALVLCAAVACVVRRRRATRDDVPREPDVGDAPTPHSSRDLGDVPLRPMSTTVVSTSAFKMDRAGSSTTVLPLAVTSDAFAAYDDAASSSGELQTPAYKTFSGSSAQVASPQPRFATSPIRQHSKGSKKQRHQQSSPPAHTYGSAPRAENVRRDAYDSVPPLNTPKKATSTGSVVRKRTSLVVAGNAVAWRVNIGDIEMQKPIGEGAFGVVWKGKWHGKYVAVKQVKAATAGGVDQRELFEAEIGRMASLPYHENLVQLHGATTLENGDIAAVVEFCPGGALVDVLYGSAKRDDWTEDALLRIAHGAACGLAHLHRLGVVHRDIAARNVLLGKHDIAKVSDFGMAREMGEEAYEAYTEAKVGPLKWMAPEQLEKQKYSSASDMFAFGVLLFEIFAQEVPWKGIAGTAAVISVVSGKRMKFPRSAPADVSLLAEQCWRATASLRPTAESAQATLAELLDNSYNYSNSEETS